MSRGVTHNMQVAVLTCLAIALMAVLAPGPGIARIERDLCEECRRYTDSSPSRFEGHISYREHVKTIKVCSLYCLLKQFDKYDGCEVDYILVVDYAHHTDDVPGKLRAEKAVYLVNCQGKEEKCHPPFVFGFRNEKQATPVQDELGGELLDWDEACGLVRKVITAEEEEEQEKRDQDDADDRHERVRCGR